MTIQNPGESMPPSHPAAQTDADHAHCVAEADAIAAGELSEVGVLVDGILSELDGVSDLSEGARMTIGLKFGNILALCQEYDERDRFANRKISALKRNVRVLTEQLAILRQECFDKSSEKGPPGEEEDEPDSPFDDDDNEEEDKQAKPKGKRARKIPKDVEPQVVHHYPEDRNCTCCGLEMPSISSWSSIQVRIVPEHVRISSMSITPAPATAASAARRTGR